MPNRPSDPVMHTSGGQLCARARFWASLRVDGELSELEGALLDAHLPRCADCSAFQASADWAAALLRRAPLVAPAPVQLNVRRPRRRVLLGAAGLAVVVGAALLGGLVHGSVAPNAPAPTAIRSIAVVESVETPDQLRRLRRTSLLNERRIPRDISVEPV